MNGWRHSVRAKLAEANRPTSGQALVMIGVMMMALIGFAALATDTGFIWMNRRSLQNAVDAAALAGVQALPEDTGSAMSYACDYGTNKNAVASMFGKTGACGAKADVTFDNGNTRITVTSFKTIHPIFGAAVGFGDIEISATATAVVGSIASSCPFPLFQTPGNIADAIGPNGEIADPPVLTKLKAGPSGEFLALEVNGSASKNAWANIVGSPAGCDGTQATIDQTLLDVNPGTFEGPFKSAMQSRQALWTSQGTCPSNNPMAYRQPDGTYWNNGVQLLPKTCYRMVVIPLINADLSTIKPSDKFPAAGYAIFYLAAWCANPTCPATADFNHSMAKGELWGYYLRMATQSDQYVDFNGYGTKVFALVN